MDQINPVNDTQDNTEKEDPDQEPLLGFDGRPKHQWRRSLWEMPYKRNFLARVMVCPACNWQGMDLAEDGANCPGCGAHYERSRHAVNVLSEDMKAQMNIVDTDNVSARNVYDSNAHAIIRHVEENGGMVLDCGAGKRMFRSPHVLQLEVVPYHNIDVLAVNQKLPFADNVFEAVFSMDVLEHVNDPFGSMDELVRVLRPGGILYLDLPFLQSEHGYPHHYFNATRMGVRHLVRDKLDVEAHIVPISGQPIVTVQQILNVYARSLPEDLRNKFMGMTVGELTQGPLRDWLRQDVVQGMPADKRWELASTTQGIFRKPYTDSRVLPAKTYTLSADMLPAYGRPADLEEAETVEWNDFDALSNLQRFLDAQRANPETGGGPPRPPRDAKSPGQASHPSDKDGKK